MPEEMEDIIEEVMGDIDDEYDEEEPEIQKIDESTTWLQCSRFCADFAAHQGRKSLPAG